MTPHDEQDSLAVLFGNVVLPPVDDLRREAIFVQTRGVLWRRRLLRRSAWVVALATCYVVGALSVLAWQSAVPRDSLAGQPEAPAEIKSPHSPEQPQPSPTREEPTRLPDEPQQAIAQVEPAETLTTFEKLRRAGDRQLNQRGNLQGAIGCYRRALDFASDVDLQIVPERDSWLLIPLKEARLETRKHAHKKS